MLQSGNGEWLPTQWGARTGVNVSNICAEANHGFVAFRVELFVVTCLKLVKLSKSGGVGVVLEAVLKIGQKS